MNKHRIPAIIEKERIVSSLSKGERLDGRGVDDVREIKIETGVIKKAEGSAQVSIGKTQVIAGVKVGIGTPFPDTPNNGVCTVTAEFSPLASPLFEPGPPDEDSIELARVVDRGIRHSEIVDTEKICIIPGEKVFILFIDIYTLNDEGNLLDAASLAAISALLTTQIPKYKIEEKDGNKEVVMLEETQPLPIENLPVQLTFAMFGETAIVDPTVIEESSMDTRLTVTIDKNNNVVSMQKGEEGPLSWDLIKSCIDRAIKITKPIRKKLPKGS